MALNLDTLRATADRVAASHGLVVVDLAFSGGGGKHRTLRVSLEKDSAGRERLRQALERLSAGDDEEEENPASGSPAVDAEWSREWLEALPSVKNLEHLSGITHEDCEVFSKDFSVLLDVEDLVPGAEYTLEVSSPGLDRRVSTPEEFHRFEGCLVKLETDGVPGSSGEESRGRKKLQGRIAGVEEDRLLLMLEGLEGAKAAKGRKRAKPAEQASEPVAIPFEAISKAHLVPEF